MIRPIPASNTAARWGLFVALSMISGLFLGCNDDNGKKNEDTQAADSSENSNDTSSDTPSRDIGANNPNLLAAIGDSITAGTMITGPSYPQRLSSILGMTVLNRGASGALSSAAGSQASGALSQKPAYLLILFGTNDVLREIPPDTVVNNIAVVVRQARAQKTIAVVATIPPILRSDYENGFAASVNARIKSMAAREGAILVNVNAEFGSGAGLIQADGYHPNETGNQIIAFAFADAIR